MGFKQILDQYYIKRFSPSPWQGKAFSFFTSLMMRNISRKKKAMLTLNFYLLIYLTLSEALTWNFKEYFEEKNNF